MTGEAGEPTTYRFGPLQRRGLVAGWRGGQIASVATGLVGAVGVLRAEPSIVGAAMALAAVAVGAVVATWPVSGRTAEEWAPDAVRHTLGRGRIVWQARGNVFAGLRILDVEVDASGRHPGTGPTGRVGGGTPARAGIVVDERARTYTAVLSVGGAGFVLLGADDKARRVARWAGVLASLARQGTLVHRLQWIERSLPDAGAAIHRHAREHAVLDMDTAAGRSYRQLVAESTPVTYRHEVLLAMSLHARSAARAVRAAGGGDAGACTVLLREVASLRRRLGDAEVTAGPVLDGAALSDAVRRGFDHDTGVDLGGGSDGCDAAARTRETRHGRSAWPWPMALRDGWACAQADGSWHATFWVAEWPRTDVGPDFLGPLLLVSDVRRSVAVVMEPVPPLDAVRQVEQSRTADIADAELRRRGGFLATARRRREEEVLVRREVELADGHAQFRFTGYVTVSADDPDALHEACGRIEQAAGQAGLELRRCYGDQARAFACTLPLTRGLS
jgi:Putative type VII ESX secretion system translocon, EccE